MVCKNPPVDYISPVEGGKKENEIVHACVCVSVHVILRESERVDESEGWRWIFSGR